MRGAAFAERGPAGRSGFWGPGGAGKVVRRRALQGRRTCGGGRGGRSLPDGQTAGPGVWCSRVNSQPAGPSMVGWGDSSGGPGQPGGEGACPACPSSCAEAADLGASGPLDLHPARARAPSHSLGRFSHQAKHSSFCPRER